MSFSDTIQFLKQLSFSKIRNGVLLYKSFQKSIESGNPEIKGFPNSIAIEPTTSCNLRCPECPSGLRSFTRPTGMLSPSLFENVLKEIGKTLSYTTLYFQGEPYLNPNFLDLVKIASKYNVYSATSTNAHYLDKETAIKTVKSGLSRAIISIDGITQESYESYRIGGSLKKVLEGTKNLIEAKKDLNSSIEIIFQFLVVKPNEHEIENAKKLAKEVGVDAIKFKTAQIYDYKNGNELIPTLDKYSRYRKNKDGSYSIKNKLENKCWKMWQSCVITWDGKVVPCCFDKDAKYVMGDLNKQSFKDIWNGSLYQSFRKRLITNRQSIDICQNCTEGLKVFE